MNCLKTAIAVGCVLLAYVHSAQGRQAVYDKDGKVKTVEERKSDENAKSQEKANAASAPAGGSGSGSGTSAEFRKSVRDAKASTREEKEKGEKALKNYDFVGSELKGNLRPVRKEGKWGYISSFNGSYVKVRIPVIYDELRFTTNDLYGVKLGNKWGFVNSYGAVQVPIQFDELIRGFEGRTTALVLKEGKQFEIDRLGGEIGQKTDLATGKMETVKMTGSASIVDARDKQTYSTIKIGNQTWLAENLGAATFKNGDLIPEAKTAAEWNEASKQQKPAWCYYNNDPENGKIYGKIYNHYAVADLRGLAPEGWKVASTEDYALLVKTIRFDSKNAMKSKSGWLINEGTNSSGFTALPGGYRHGADFSNVGKYGIWWTSTPGAKPTEAAYRSIDADSKYSRELDGSDNTKDEGYYVRCVLL
jgi:uncharacterized protein (TIGR02145 family)